MKPVISIGNQDFRSIRENHNFYVDKSDFIREWWENQKYRALQGSYPVIFLSFASVKGETYPEAREGIIQIILDLYTKYDYLRLSDKLSEKEKAYFDFIKSDMSNTIAALSLHRLALCMNRYYGKKVLILLDEYDTPLQEAYVRGYWNELTSFMSNLFNATFKTNPYMERGLLTGITRV